MERRFLLVLLADGLGKTDVFFHFVEIEVLPVKMPVRENVAGAKVDGSVEFPFKRRTIRIEPALWVNVQRCGHP